MFELLGKNITMDKSNSSTGQPILSQILSCIPSSVISSANRKHLSNRYYKKIPLRVHLVTLLYGVFSYCNGLRELCEGMLACEGKLFHLGLNQAPARSTLSDANTKRDYRVFETIYFALVKQYHSYISDSRLKGLSIRNLKIIDSTTIRLFTDILQGVGRPPLDGSRKKGGLKVHALMDAFSGIAEFVRITEGKLADRKFLHHLDLPAGSFVAFDKGYYHYAQFDRWTQKKVWFITRMKDNCLFHVTKVMIDRTKKRNAKGVVKDQWITVGYKELGHKGVIRLKLRRITFIAEDNKHYVFLTNNFTLPASQVTLIYKSRWMIELLFKQIKQNFPIRYFWGNSANAIKMQVYCVLIAQLLMVVIRKKANTKKSFANMITVVRLHLTSYVHLLEFIKDSYKAWRKAHNAPMAFAT